MSRSMLGVGDAQGEDDVAPESALIVEELGEAGQQFLDDVVVGFLAFRVPHLLVAAEGKDVEGLVDFTIAAKDPFGISKGSRNSVVGVLGAHHPWNKEHVRPLVGRLRMLRGWRS